MIGYLEVAVEDIKIMQPLESECDLNESAPYGQLVKGCACFLMSDNLLVEVPVVEKLHYNAGW